MTLNGKPQLQFTNCGMKNNTHPIKNYTKPFPFYSFKRVQYTSVKYEHCHFFSQRENIYSGSTFTIPGSGFDTTCCRNRNHNKLGGHLFARPGTRGLQKTLLVLREMPASLCSCLSRCGKRKSNFLPRRQKLL